MLKFVIIQNDHYIVYFYSFKISLPSSCSVCDLLFLRIWKCVSDIETAYKNTKKHVKMFTRMKKCVQCKNIIELHVLYQNHLKYMLDYDLFFLDKFDFASVFLCFLTSLPASLFWFCGLFSSRSDYNSAPGGFHQVLYLFKYISAKTIFNMVTTRFDLTCMKIMLACAKFGQATTEFKLATAVLNLATSNTRFGDCNIQFGVCKVEYDNSKPE